MTKEDRYTEIFAEVMNVDKSMLNESFTFENVDDWTSLVHMTLVMELEDAFDIMFEPEDILHYGSYENGKKILEKYGVVLSEEV